MPRALGMVLVLLLAACQTVQPNPQVLTFAPHLQHNLGILAEGLANELPVCLTGEIRGDTVILDQIHIPRINHSDTVSTNYDGTTCPKNTLAFWHNHPKPETVTFSDGPNPGCWISYTDIRTSTQERRLFEIVQTSRYNWCWFTRLQIAARVFMEGDFPDYIPIIKGQGEVPFPFIPPQ